MTEGTNLDPETIRVVSTQLGRPARGLQAVAVLCPHGLPAVIETRPYLEDRTPFPTLLYLTCPTLVTRVSTAEAAGGVEALRELTRGDLAEEFESLAIRYRRRRENVAGAATAAADGPGRMDGGAVLAAGVGGPADPGNAACLHAYVAAVLAEQAGWLGPSEGDVLVRALVAPLGPLWCTDARCRGPESRERRAAIDVGTNSVRLLVADIERSGEDAPPVTVIRRATVTRLGEGLNRSGSLGEAAMARTNAAVEGFVREARSLGATSITLVGTSATRDAENGLPFVRELGRQLGITAGVATGEMEAALTYAGATLELPDDVVLMDLGGGSTELVRRQPDGRLLTTSLDVGCVRASEAWLLSDPPSARERVEVRREAAMAFERAGDPYRGATFLAGVAGTVTTLSALILGLDAYDPDSVHLSVFTREQLGAQLERLAGLSREERVALPTMQPGRADVIVAGAEILAAALETLGYDEVVVSERDILDGIILATR